MGVFSLIFFKIEFYLGSRHIKLEKKIWQNFKRAYAAFRNSENKKKIKS